MNFKQAFDEEITERTKKDQSFRIKEESLKIMAFMWNILARAENKLDDIAVIDNNNNIISIPIMKAVEKDVKKEKETVKKPTAEKPKPIKEK